MCQIVVLLMNKSRYKRDRKSPNAYKIVGMGDICTLLTYLKMMAHTIFVQ